MLHKSYWCLHMMGFHRYMLGLLHMLFERHGVLLLKRIFFLSCHSVLQYIHLFQFLLPTLLLVLRVIDLIQCSIPMLLVILSSFHLVDTIQDILLVIDLLHSSCPMMLVYIQMFVLLHLILAHIYWSNIHCHCNILCLLQRWLFYILPWQFLIFLGRIFDMFLHGHIVFFVFPFFFCSILLMILLFQYRHLLVSIHSILLLI
mmetsp:Transcript_159/g.274  ORF Transcript_159/g.274 Transcript_159/m.274 type:complete len:202 (-) Transcript_159:469-1074(-)